MCNIVLSNICKLGVCCLQNPKKRLGLVLVILVRSYSFFTSLRYCLLSSGHPATAAAHVPRMFGLTERQDAAHWECGLTLRNNSLGLQPWKSCSSTLVWALVLLGSHTTSQASGKHQEQRDPEFSQVRLIRQVSLNPTSGSLITARQMCTEEIFPFLQKAWLRPVNMGLLTDPDCITWSPVGRNNVLWNFKKFLVGPDSVSVQRYSHHFPTSNAELDIEALVHKAPHCA